MEWHVQVGAIGTTANEMVIAIIQGAPFLHIYTARRFQLNNPIRQQAISGSDRYFCRALSAYETAVLTTVRDAGDEMGLTTDSVCKSMGPEAVETLPILAELRLIATQDTLATEAGVVRWTPTHWPTI